MNPFIDVIDRYQDLWTLDSFCRFLCPGTRNWTETHEQSRNTGCFIKREKHFESGVGQSWAQGKGFMASVPSGLSDFVGPLGGGHFLLHVPYLLDHSLCGRSFHFSSTGFCVCATIDLLAQLDDMIFIGFYHLHFFSILVPVVCSWPCFFPLYGLSFCYLWSFSLVVVSLAVQDLLNFMCTFLLFPEIVSCFIRVWFRKLSPMSTLLKCFLLAVWKS